MKYLGELNWTQAAEARAQNALVLLPIGSTEAHGPHLPLSTDSIISEELCVRAAVALEAAGETVLVAPTISYAKTDYASEFAGTISVSGETATRLVAEIAGALISQGFLRVCLVNNHLEPAHIESLRRACELTQQRSGHLLAFPDQTEKRWARTLSEEFKRGECHAGRYETSLVLAARPKLVDNAARAALSPLPIDLVKEMHSGKQRFVEMGANSAYFGDPAAATAAEGETLYALLVTMVTTTIKETWRASAQVEPDKR